MENQESSATEVRLDDWSVNPRGYISGGSEVTPMFLEMKRRFNTARTRKINKIKHSVWYGNGEPAVAIYYYTQADVKDIAEHSMKKLNRLKGNIHA